MGVAVEVAVGSVVGVGSMGVVADGVGASVGVNRTSVGAGEAPPQPARNKIANITGIRLVDMLASLPIRRVWFLKPIHAGKGASGQGYRFFRVFPTAFVGEPPPRSLPLTAGVASLGQKPSPPGLLVRARSHPRSRYTVPRRPATHPVYSPPGPALSHPATR
jgi:hypothetical protein